MRFGRSGPKAEAHLLRQRPRPGLWHDAVPDFRADVVQSNLLLQGVLQVAANAHNLPDGWLECFERRPQALHGLHTAKAHAKTN